MATATRTVEAFLYHLRPTGEGESQRFDDSVKAHACVKVDGHYLVSGLHVVQKANGTLKIVGYPGDSLSSLWKDARPVAKGRAFFQCCNLDAETREIINQAVISAYEKGNWSNEAPALTEDGEWRKRETTFKPKASTGKFQPVIAGQEAVAF